MSAAAAEIAGGTVFIAVLLIAFGIRFLFAATVDRRGRRVLRRMSAFGVGDFIVAARDLRLDHAITLWVPRWLQALLAQANLDPCYRGVVGVVAGDIALSIAASWFGGYFIGALCGAMLVGGELAILRTLAARRLATFMADLPVFLDKVVQLVKIGKSLRQALERANDASPPVIKAYLAPALRRIANGAPVDEALRGLAARLDIIEFHMLVLTLEANLVYGGRLAGSIGFLVQILRDKQRIDRELRASTSEGRATAWLTGLLPLAVAAFEWVRSPEFAAYFFTTSQGHVMLTIALGLEWLGVLLLNRILKVSY